MGAFHKLLESVVATRLDAFWQLHRALKRTATFESSLRDCKRDCGDMRFLRKLEAMDVGKGDTLKGGKRRGCHRSLQNQPVRVESKPATLRCLVHIKFPGAGKGPLNFIYRCGALTETERKARFGFGSGNLFSGDLMSLPESALRTCCIVRFQ